MLKNQFTVSGSYTTKYKKLRKDISSSERTSQTVATRIITGIKKLFTFMPKTLSVAPTAFNRSLLLSLITQKWAVFI